MTKESFELFWDISYPKSLPMSHYLRRDYKTRWFRIHSLPEAKRYATTSAEWSILLTRQNQIITDLLGDNSEVLLVTGEYSSRPNDIIYSIEDEQVLKPYRFSILDSRLDESGFLGQEDIFYRPVVAEFIWTNNQYNSLLKALANDEVRAFFISTSKNIIVAPYDGGIDFLLSDEATKNFYKLKYQAWLSERKDEL